MAVNISVGTKVHSEIPHYKLLSDVPEELYKKVYYVYLSGINLTDVPEIIYGFTNLEILDISNNQISDFPLEILNFKKLRMLYMQCNSITNIPEKAINMLANLKQFESDFATLRKNDLMIINYYDDDILISDEINTLIIYHFGKKVLFNNLPPDLRYLKISNKRQTYIVLNNIPSSLETLVLNNVTLINNVKIPFCCNVFTS